MNKKEVKRKLDSFYKELISFEEIYQESFKKHDSSNSLVNFIDKMEREIVQIINNLDDNQNTYTEKQGK